MSKETQRVDDGQNRCRRCDRPLSNPNDMYGWRCAQIVGLDAYQKAMDSLDEEGRILYTKCVERYLGEDNTIAISKNPESKVSFLPATDWKDASDIIVRNADAIKNAGRYYEVNPAIIAACIYTEQITNVNILDPLTDVPFYWADTSIGIGQVKVSTAKMLEDEGYIAKTEYHSMEVYGNRIVARWKTPGHEGGVIYAGSREEAIAHRLTTESENINYVAAYLRYYQDRWKDAYPEIDGRTAVLATLYNQGEQWPPHGNPKPNDFGKQAKSEYYYMRQLLGLD